MKRHKPRLTVVQAFLAAAGGLILYLVPQDAKAQAGSPLREIYVALAAAAVALTLLLLFKSYETVATALVISMLLVLVHYIVWSIQMGIEDSRRGTGFMLHLSYYDGICWGLIWLIPFAICMAFRMFSLQNWDTVKKRVDFFYFIQRAGLAFAVYYTILFFSWFLFLRQVQIGGERSINLIPFGSLIGYFSDFSGSFNYMVGHVLFFIPVGFFLCVFKASWRWYQRLLLAVGFGVFIELCQFGLNTGVLDIDDLLLNLAGFGVGAAVKRLADYMRLRITAGEETGIQYLPVRW